jgi:hypothetical protein
LLLEMREERRGWNPADGMCGVRTPLMIRTGLEPRASVGAQNGEIQVKVLNIGTGVGQNKSPFTFRLCFQNNGCTVLTNSSGVARFENLKSQDYCLYVTNGDQCAYTDCFKLCPDKIIGVRDKIGAADAESGGFEFYPESTTCNHAEYFEVLPYAWYSLTIKELSAIEEH